MAVAKVKDYRSEDAAKSKHNSDASLVNLSHESELESLPNDDHARKRWQSLRDQDDEEGFPVELEVITVFGGGLIL